MCISLPVRWPMTNGHVRRSDKGPGQRIVGSSDRSVRTIRPGASGLEADGAGIEGTTPPPNRSSHEATSFPEPSRTETKSKYVP